MSSDSSNTANSTPAQSSKAETASSKSKPKKRKPSELMLNVGGMYFETDMATFRRRRNTKLAKLNKSSEFYVADKDEYFFDRDPIIFRSVLDFYRYDELHFPHNICGAVVRRELEYWGINEKFVAPCCWQFFKSCSDNDMTVDLLYEEFDDFSRAEYILSSRARLFGWIWDFLEDPASSLPAKVPCRVGVRARVRVRVRVRVCVCARERMYARSLARSLASTHARTHAHTNTHTNTHTHTHTPHARTHASTHARTHARTHAHTHTHTHTHTCTLSSNLSEMLIIVTPRTFA